MKAALQMLSLAGLALLLGLTPAQAQVNWQVDEWGHLNGQLLGSLEPDPSGGVPNGNVLVYTLPFAGVRGDVLLFEPPRGLDLSDVVRFDGNYHLIFYSDNIDGYDAPADSPAPPSPLYPNQVSFLESGVDGGMQLLNYTPGPNQPGWDPSNPSYTFISDVPEPAGATLLLVGLGLAGTATRRRN